MAQLTDYSKFTAQPPKRKRKGWIIFLFLFILISTSLFIIQKFTVEKTSQQVEKPQVFGIVEKSTTIFNPDENSDALGTIVQHELKNTKGEYGIVINNLKTGERYYYNEHKIFEAASLYKLFVMATVFQKIQNGNLTQNDVLSQKISVLNQKFKISSESAELTEGDITLPVQSALSRMITISDNYSALLLTEKVRLSQVSLLLSQNSLTESKVGSSSGRPSTSAYDMALFYKKLYEGKIAEKSLTAGMLSLLKHQMLNTKIPKYLPKNVDVSHKTGELGLLSHDAGIVYTPKGDYIIIVLTETSSPAVANEIIAKISKSVYEYFVK